MRQPLARPTACIVAAFCVVLAFSATASAADNNRGTIKIHDGPVADPEERNQPHVSCDFYVQGFNMHDPTGYLKFIAWPPTGDKDVVVPTGDTLSWTGTPDGDGEWDFLKGAYFLPEGHYRLEAYTFDDHPGHNEGHFAKAKMFWVDPCEEEHPPCVDDNSTPADDCNPPPCVDDLQTEVDECDTEIPFFPGFTSLALGSLGVLGAVGYILRRRS